MRTCGDGARRWEKAMACKLIKCWYKIQLSIGDHRAPQWCHACVVFTYISFTHTPIWFDRIIIKHKTLIFNILYTYAIFAQLWKWQKINLYYFIGHWCAFDHRVFRGPRCTNFPHKSLVRNIQFENVIFK